MSSTAEILDQTKSQFTSIIINCDVDILQITADIELAGSGSRLNSKLCVASSVTVIACSLL